MKLTKAQNYLRRLLQRPEAPTSAQNYNMGGTSTAAATIPTSGRHRRAVHRLHPVVRCMPYFTITDFAAGLDLRRSSLTAPAGTLRTLINAHITPGGEIEKRMAFVPFCDVRSREQGPGRGQPEALHVRPPTAPTSTEPPSRRLVGRRARPDCSDDLRDHRLRPVRQQGLHDLCGPTPPATSKRFYDGTDVPGANGFYCRTYKTKMYTVDRHRAVLLRGRRRRRLDRHRLAATSICRSSDSDMTDCVALEVYYDKLAIFSKTATQLWIIDPDPLQEHSTRRRCVRPAPSLGTACCQYGSGDVMYLSQSGIRSLRARNSSLAAAVSRHRLAAGPVIQDLFRYMGEDWMSGTIAMLQPVTGRFWVIFPDRIYILSAFPGPKITAWSEYHPTDDAGLTLHHHRGCDPPEPRLCARRSTTRSTPSAAPATSAPIYDDCPVEMIFPFHAGDQPATYKTYRAGRRLTGVWDVSGAFNIEDDTAEDYLGEFIGPTFLQGRFPIMGTRRTCRCDCAPRAWAADAVELGRALLQTAEHRDHDRAHATATTDPLRAAKSCARSIASRWRRHRRTWIRTSLPEPSWTRPRWCSSPGDNDVAGELLGAWCRCGSGVGYAFCLRHRRLGLAVLPMTRHVRRFMLPILLDNGYHRIEARSLADRNDVGRWLEIFGAEAEAVMRGSGARGEDFILYRWLRDEHRPAKHKA